MTRRSKIQWQDLFSQHESSGLTATEFCRRHSLCQKYFSSRKRQLGWSGSSAFVQAKPVQVQPSIEPSAQPGDVTLRVIELTVPGERLSSTLSSLLR